MSKKYTYFMERDRNRDKSVLVRCSTDNRVDLYLNGAWEIFTPLPLPFSPVGKDENYPFWHEELTEEQAFLEML